jgi:hypothetical protein
MRRRSRRWTRPWQKVIVAEAEEQDAPQSPAGGRPAGPGIVGYASFGPETNVLTEPWPHPLTEAGRDGQLAELYVPSGRTCGGPIVAASGPNRST